MNVRQSKNRPSSLGFPSGPPRPRTALGPPSLVAIISDALPESRSAGAQGLAFLGSLLSARRWSMRKLLLPASALFLVFAVGKTVRGQDDLRAVIDRAIR